MNSSTLRRLAADHASLRTSELPPYYFFPVVETSAQDDLTQLTIFLTGPQGTPYSQGVWKLWLKIPEDYPKAPPRACFRTRIWHPNVEENSGSICVDTLKKDWEPKLTLRDVLITISCLLIQPNPDSALNATAGHLLQEDYQHFARQAKLMTSIHATIPHILKDAAVAAKKRGEAPGTVYEEQLEQRPSLKPSSAHTSSVVMKKLPQRPTIIPLTNIPRATSTDTESVDIDDENSASKENDPTHSPQPVPMHIPRRPNLAKRPLSDLPCPTEEELDQACLSPSEQNIANNSPNSTAEVSTSIRDADVNSAGRNLKDASTNTTAAAQGDVEVGRSAKRICSDDAKENGYRRYGVATPALSSYTTFRSAKVQSTVPKNSGIPGSGGGKITKPRIGLRRL